MKLQLPVPKSNYKTYLIKDLFMKYLEIHTDLCIESQNCQIETYESWDFYRVSVFKEMRKSGYGHSEHRNSKWEKIKNEIVEIFDLKRGPESTWRWLNKSVDNLDLYDKIGDREGYIPGIMFWVYKEKS